jgi:hypothetical protein
MHDMLNGMSKQGPLDFSWFTYAWVALLSFWGGIANYVSKVKRGDSRFNLLEIFGEMIVSGFAGVMTFYICTASHTPEVVTAVAVGISGHMGARIITQIEQWITRRFGLKHSSDIKDKDSKD